MIAIDIGNTKIKAGIVKDNTLVEFYSFTNPPDVIEFIKSYQNDETAVSSVVPDLTKYISEELEKIGIKPFIITKDIKTNLAITYKSPETLGPDRICSAEGVFFLFKNSKKYKDYNEKIFILSVDMGTATTINVVEYPGKFIGGSIAPGIEMMFESLSKKTAQLPLLDESNFNSEIGNDTNSSIAAGVINSVTGMIEITIDFLKKGYSAKEIVVYLTGGNAKKIIPHLNFNFVYEEGLVLYGINALWKLNNKK